MIRRTLSHFLRKPLTPESARDLFSADFGRATKDGLYGFCYAVFFRPGSTDAQAALASKGDITSGLAQVLQMLLSSPGTKAQATQAIITALQETGGAQVVQVLPEGDDCDCAICTMRKVLEGKRPTNTTTH